MKTQYFKIESESGIESGVIEEILDRMNCSLSKNEISVLEIPMASEEGEDKLQELLLEQVIFFGAMNTDQEIGLCVNCSDVFYWGCADSEPLTWDLLDQLYDFWKADPIWGPVKWCMMKRETLPQQLVLDAMIKEGAWDQELKDFFAENDLKLVNSHD